MSINHIKFGRRLPPFTTILNEVINSIDNFDALALWTYLQSKPENWEVRQKEICNRFSIGRDRYYKALRKLKELGLIETETVRSERGGRLAGKTIIVHSTLPDNRLPENPTIGEPTHIVINKKDNKKLNTNALFEEFYKAYPKHRAKHQAMKAWVKNGCEELARQIIQDVNSRSEGEWKDMQSQFIPYPATYLNQHRWEDESDKPKENQSWEDFV